MRRPATTFYFHESRNPKQEKAYKVLKKMERKKLDFLIWMINVTEMTYGVNFDELNKKELLALMKTPIPQHNQMTELMEKLSNALAMQNEVEKDKAKLSDSRKEKNKERQSAPNIEDTAKASTVHAEAKEDPISLIDDDNPDSDELSESQSDMLFDGLSGFNL